ncbi:MAG TPA: signal peptidase I [Nitrososphaerales archaeon]|nr:signal peptidase I [Nitrososphaerales archaeon]
MAMKKLSRGAKIEIFIASVAAAMVIALPLCTQTSNYPLAIVQGNSMFPTLHNGDIEVFAKPPSGTIANGTIIVFVQGDTGVSGLDSLIRPVVVHRIVGTVVQGDGQVYYRTKGDNNQYVDPQLVEASHVLGVPIETIPQAGIVVLFFESPEGLVALLGFIVLYYLGQYEVKVKDGETRDTFLGELTKLLLEGEISHELFERLEPVVKYGKRVRLDGINDALILSLMAWMRKGGLERGWKVVIIDCPVCSSRATSFVSSENTSFTVCQHCASQQEVATNAGPELIQKTIKA